MARDAPASDRRADVGLGPTRATDTPLAGRTASDLASSPTLMDNTNALRAAVDWNLYQQEHGIGIYLHNNQLLHPTGGSTAPTGVPQTEPPAIGPGGDAGAEGMVRKEQQLPERPATDSNRYGRRRRYRYSWNKYWLCS